MRPVQKQVPEPFRGTAGNHNRCSMRAFATDGLAVPR
jgi:hypothetical protein